MGDAPLYDALKAFAEARPLRMHMPGHKGKPIPELTPLTELDFTELPPTGDLFAGDGPIRAAEALWADAFSMSECLFLTGGSTQGMLTALTLACRDGGASPALLLDRGSHRSAYNALALLDLTPVYLERPWLAGEGVSGPVSPESVEKALLLHPEIKTLCITSPTYYGVLSDISTLAGLMHAHGGILVVDAAHGAHLPFLGDRSLSSADLVIASAHKTLPSLGQTALLLSGPRFSHDRIRSAAALYGSSSPSYLLMASLDLSRAWMVGEGAAAYRRAAAETDRLRARFPSLTNGGPPLDPTRLVLKVSDGYVLQEALARLGVYPEMADAGHVLFILTGADSREDILRLEDALRAVLPTGTVPRRFPPPPPLPEAVLTPREARFAPVCALPLEQAVGRILARQVAPYPPGVPVVAPGERLDKKHLAYLSEIGYNMEEVILAVS